MNNDPAVNAAIDSKLRELKDRAAQQPVSYIQLFREAHEIACEQFMRAMAAEAKLYRRGDGEATP